MLPQDRAEQSAFGTGSIQKSVLPPHMMKSFALCMNCKSENPSFWVKMKFILLRYFEDAVGHDERVSRSNYIEKSTLCGSEIMHSHSNFNLNAHTHNNLHQHPFFSPSQSPISISSKH